MAELIAEFISRILFEIIGRAIMHLAGRVLLFLRYRNARTMLAVVDARYQGSYAEAAARIIGRPLYGAALWLWVILFVCFLGGLVWYLLWEIAT